MSLRHLAGPVLVAALLGGVSCGDPIHDVEVTALGPEAPGVSPGPNHRPGQPCLLCHGGLGPGNTTFVTAGTIYASEYAAGTTSYLGASGADVHLIDATGSTHEALTNASGNFYVTSDMWNPVFPIGEYPIDSGMAGNDITVAPGGVAMPFPIPMKTSIGRGGEYASCAYCHFDPPGPTSPGHIYAQ
jgi:hypothetical protein